MDTEERHELVLRRLQEVGRVEVADLALAFGVSGLTIRRDLDQLAAAGVLSRVHGGAISLMLRGEGLPYPMRAIDHADVKVRMAKAASALIADGEAVAVDSGTTGAAAATALASRRVTVMPMSIQGIAALSTINAGSLILPGGSVRGEEGTVVGPLAERTIRSLRFDVAVLTCCGVSASDGVTAHDLQDAAMKLALVESSRRTVLLAEGAKFARTAMAVVCGLNLVDVIVTDSTAPEDALDRLRSDGINVVVV